MRKAIIIGASSGIGKELALVLSSEGYQVGIVARRGHLLEEIVASNREKFIAKECDITVQESAIHCLEELAAELKGIDLLVISAATGELNQTLDQRIELQTTELNVKAFTKVIDWGYNHFKKQNLGHIVAISSMMGLRGSAIAPAYSASKAYQINYLESLRQRAQIEAPQTTITEIRAGSTRTQMMKGEGHFWINTPQKAAKEILRAIKKKKAVYYVSRRWMIIGFLMKIMPRGIYKRMGKL